MKFFIKAAALTMLIVSLTFSACGGGGDTGGGDTETPASTLFASKSPIAPGAICPAGGIRIDMGFDNNKNNILDADEITKTEYVCNGEDASSHPFVVYTSPTPNETDVELDTVISAVFNTEMDETTITDQTFTVKDSNGNSVAGTVSYGGIVAVFTPTEPLSINMKYTVNLLSTIENENDIATGYDHKIYFTGGKAAVIYKDNGATGGTVPVDTNRYNTGATVNASTNSGNLSKSGYSFSGWNTKADGTGTPYAVGAQVSITTGSVILYAIWSTGFTVTYDANGGSGSIPTNSNLYASGHGFSVSSNVGNLYKNGYVFSGWNTKDDGTGDCYDVNSTFLVGSSNVTLYALWTTFLTVTYDANGGSGSVPTDSNAYTYGQNATIKANLNLNKSGFLFAGWNTKNDGAGKSYTSGASIKIAGINAVLYAIWYTPIVLKYIPVGSFQRDSIATNISTISTSFYMSETEITRAQFLAVMGVEENDPYCSSGMNDPVGINWYHAIAFCNKLSIAEGLTPVYTVASVNFATLTYSSIPLYSGNAIWDAATANFSANGYRLPTEMEWMWAAMGATSGFGYTGPVYLTGYSKLFAGSNGANAEIDYAWLWENYPAFFKTHPVKTKLPNEIGLYDMTGSAFEWCWDWYEEDSAITGTQVDYRGAVSGTARTLKGGCMHIQYGTVLTKISVIDGMVPFVNGPDFGFRVIRR